ncbi:hypothetical protein BCR43DRAFT_70214 [Syncephalastrum racemosum]|uniref:Uncharacterized protein n=1 Tax=Syncephalastrum racemosum TaxID=13706 RepID=A0A1X2HWP3_SYNRA|nr:hypothetical protein BCR43DRAFT_70214 [Syncephalastrum racemosum]
MMANYSPPPQPSQPAWRGQKRRRSSSSPSSSGEEPRQHVRFASETEVIYTHAPKDYDRGGIFAFPILYKLNPAVLLSPNSCPDGRPQEDPSSLSTPSSSPTLSPSMAQDLPPVSTSSLTASFSSDEDADSVTSSVDLPLTPAPPPLPGSPPPPAQQQQQPKKKQSRPKLSIDTSVCSQGPLFLTKLSTNHVRTRTWDDDSGGGESTISDYLVPMTAVPQ